MNNVDNPVSCPDKKFRYFYKEIGQNVLTQKRDIINVFSVDPKHSVTKVTWIISSGVNIHAAEANPCRQRHAHFPCLHMLVNGVQVVPQTEMSKCIMDNTVLDREGPKESEV